MRKLRQPITKSSKTKLNINKDEFLTGKDARKRLGRKTCYNEEI